MADFTPEHPFWSNFQISITSEMYGVEGWNFQGLIISTLSTNSEKKNKIWEVRTAMRWMIWQELPKCQIGFKLGSFCSGEPSSCWHVMLFFYKPRDCVMTIMLSVSVFQQIWSQEGKKLENHQMLDVWKAYGRKIKIWLTSWLN